MDESLSDDKLLFRQFMRAHERFYNFGHAQIIRSRWYSSFNTELLILGKGFESAHSLFFFSLSDFLKRWVYKEVDINGGGWGVVKR